MRRHTCQTFLHQKPARICAFSSPGLEEPYLTKTMYGPCKQGVANHLQPNTRQVRSRLQTCCCHILTKLSCVQNLLDKSYLSNYTLGARCAWAHAYQMADAVLAEVLPAVGHMSIAYHHRQAGFSGHTYNPKVMQAVLDLISSVHTIGAACNHHICHSLQPMLDAINVAGIVAMTAGKTSAITCPPSISFPLTKTG